MGIRTLETAKHCPHFEGSTYEAIRQSLDKFNFDVVFDLGSEYTGWRKPKQRRANIRHALFRDIPELKALEANPIANKERAAELLRGRIEEARGVNRYLAKTGLRSAARNIYGEKRGYDVVTQHLDFDLHPVFDLGLDFQGWANPDKAKANVREALFHDIPELKALEADPVANKEEAAELLKTKIEEAGGINPYFANIKIASAGLRAHCTAFGGSRYRAIQDSLPEFNFDLIDDLGNTSTLEWRISKLREIVRADHSQQEIRRIIVNEFGQGFNSLSKSYYAQAIAIVPESQQDYIRARRSNNELADVIEIHPRQRSRIDDIIPEIDRMHVIKLARDENGRSIPMDDYNTFICEVFGDEEFLVEALEEEGSEVIQYLRTRQIPNVATIEEVVDKGTKNPNYRMRMFLASNQEVTSNATLDSFVKFYSQEDKAIIAHEIAIANYLHTVVGLPSVGRARSVTLGAALSFDYDNSDGFTTVFKSSEPKRGAEEASYALVTPFVNITTLSEYLGERPSEKDETIQRVQDALIEFHTKGVENLGRINELSLPDRNALKYLTVENYREESHRFIRKQSGLETIYSEMGIAERLNTSAQKYTALTHGDCHPKNIVVSDEGEVVFLDFEYSRLGAAQIDEARVYAHRNMGLSMEQRLEYVRKGAQKKGINDVDEYVNAFHAAVIHTSLKHTRFVYEHAKQYGLTQAQEIIDKDISLIKEHAALISQPKDVDRLETEIRKEYNIDIYRIQGTA